MGGERPRDALSVEEDRRGGREGGGVVFLRNNKKITMIIVKLVLVPDIKVALLDVQEVMCNVHGVIQ